MQAQEVTLGRRGFRVSRVFVVILDRKVIQGVKALREIWGHRGRQDQQDRQDQWDHREISGFRGQEVFQVQPVQPVQLALWDRKA